MTALPLAIRSAIVPAAGLGTRLRPLTTAIPKEMLPIGRKPVLERVLDELRLAGIERVLIVVSPGKEMIRRYFGDGEAVGIRCEYAIQAEMRGLGDALLQGEEWAGSGAFAVAFGDCLIESSEPEPPLSRLLSSHCRTGSSATALCETVPLERTSRYGIVAPADPDAAISGMPFKLRDIVEKPQPADAPSTLAVAARWALSAEVFPWLRRTDPEANGELNLTGAVREMIRAGRPAWAAPLLQGEARWDIGGWETYLEAAARAACSDPEFGARARSACCEPAGQGVAK